MIYNGYQNNDKKSFGVSIVSSGHIFARKGRKVERPNGRGDYLLFYVAKGSAYFYLDKEVELKEGSFVIFKPFEKQIHVQKDYNVSEFYYVHFNVDSQVELSNFKSSTPYNVKASSKIRDLFEEIITELQSKQPFYEKMCVLKLFNLLTLLERKSQKETTIKGRYVDKISFVIQKMNKEYYNNYSLDEYAKMCNLSKYHFLRIFKEIVGLTPIEYRNEIRLEHAKELLTDTDYSIEEICETLGFSSNSYFCETFKKRFLKSPSQYRKLL